MPAESARSILYLDSTQILSIPEEHLPLAVLSSKAISPFAFGIMTLRHSIWNHFMWMHKPGLFASQGWTYGEVPVTQYIGFDHRLKFWWNPNWTAEQRQKIKGNLQYWLDKPKWQTRYDFLAIAGQALSVAWLQNPLFRICSDYGSALRESGVDLNYNLKNPAPDQVDGWFKDHLNYEVYGRYAGE